MLAIYQIFIHIAIERARNILSFIIEYNVKSVVTAMLI